MKKYIMLAMVALSLGFASCDSSDEDVTPSHADVVNGFAPAANDNSETAQIRRDFYSKTGSYLIFSDTLVSKNLEGKPELLDHNWAIFGSQSFYDYDYKYVYITDPARQRKVADDVEKYLVKKLGKARPFSYFLVDEVYYDYYGSKRIVKNLLGMRTYLLTVCPEGQDPESFYGDIFMSIVIDKFNRLDASITKAFTEDVENLYYEYFEDHGLPEDGPIENAWEYGFLSYVDGYYWDYFPKKENDTKEWLQTLVSMSSEEFETKYGAYPILMKRYKALTKILSDLGIEL